ncbi:MAG: M3 family oligoendopeptidase [candidate division Zixibacteria bacterium]
MSTDVNKMRWDLESIFPGGSDSKEYAEFRKKLSESIKEIEQEYEKLPKTMDDSNLGAWADFFNKISDAAEHLHHAYGFAGQLMAQDVKDEKAIIIDSEIMEMNSNLEKIITDIEDFSTRATDEFWEKLVNQPQLVTTKFFWNELRDKARMKMDPNLEKLAVELSVNGYHAWNRLYTRMAGDMTAEFTEDGETKNLSMGQLANKFASPDRAIRKQAFEKLEESWKTVASLAAMTLNFQAGYRLSLYKNRDWDSALVEPLLNGRLKRETLDAMWEAVSGGVGKIAEYIDTKKKLLGIKNFRWYDQTAPIGETEKKIEYNEACDFVVEHLTSFSPEMGKFARRVIDERWIEAEDRPGKAAGGFCSGLPLKKQSRIFMTFSGNYEEIMTLAHEIGHAYHSYVLYEQPYFARNYPFNLAETASTFNELLVTDAALGNADNEQERLVMLDHKIQEGLILFCNLHARYIFDCNFYKERENGTVARERLNELMVEAQKQAYDGILADDGYHPLFWASKLHFFETEVPFYNFPYTYGYLFSGGIYDLAKKEGPGFSEKYRSLLADTGSMTSEDIAQKHLGVDLTKIDFWKEAVNRVLADVGPYIELASKK